MAKFSVPGTAAPNLVKLEAPLLGTTQVCFNLLSAGAQEKILWAYPTTMFEMKP